MKDAITNVLANLEQIPVRGRHAILMGYSLEMLLKIRADLEAQEAKDDDPEEENEHADD